MHTKTRRYSGAVLLSALMVFWPLVPDLDAAGAAPPAGGVPSRVTGSGLAVVETSRLRVSDALNRAAEEVRDLNGHRGYTGVAGDLTTSSLRVMWKAPVPSAVQKLDGRSIGGVSVDIVPVTYSEEDIFRGSDTLLAASRRGSLPPITSITGSEDGSTLVVAVDATKVAAGARPQLRTRARALTGMPVEVVEGPTPVPTTRQNDSDPWFGGGMMFDPEFNPPNDMVPFNFCSNAFAVVTPGGFGRLLGALHCDSTANLAWEDGAGQRLTTGGTAVAGKANDDTALIDPVGGTGGQVHGGPWNAGKTHPRYHLKVGGASSPAKGTIVCSSGANSGEHCGLEVLSSTRYSFTCGAGTCRVWIAVSQIQPSVAATVGGDSGGPVYSNRSDGRVQARGVIWGGAGAAPCGNVRFGVENCFQQVWFTDIGSLQSAWGVKVETTS